MGRIKFIDYSVKYREDLEFVLRNINFNVKESEKVMKNYNHILYCTEKFYFNLDWNCGKNR